MRRATSSLSRAGSRSASIVSRGGPGGLAAESAIAPCNASSRSATFEASRASPAARS